MVVSLNYCSQNGGNLYRAPYYNGNPNTGPRIDSNLGQSPHCENYSTKRPTLIFTISSSCNTSSVCGVAVETTTRLNCSDQR